MNNHIFKRGLWKLPYEMRRSLLRVKSPQSFNYYKRQRYVSGTGDSFPTIKHLIDNKCIFVHVPKTGGMSVAGSLFGSSSSHRSISDFSYILSKEEYFSFFKFGFVRNPWDRLVSAFLYLKKGGMHEVDALWAKEHLSEYTEFREFVKHWLNEENVNLGVHFVPQFKFLSHPGKKKHEMDFVGRFEQIEQDINYVCERINISCKLNKANVTKGKRDYRKYYDDHCVDIVAKVYARDVDLFGYEFE